MYVYVVSKGVGWLVTEIAPVNQGQLEFVLHSVTNVLDKEVGGAKWLNIEAELHTSFLGFEDASRDDIKQTTDGQSSTQSLNLYSQQHCHAMPLS